MDVQRDVVDGHLHFQDEVVAFLLDKDGKELLVDVIEEELKVRATVPSAQGSFTQRVQVEVIKSMY